MIIVSAPEEDIAFVLAGGGDGHASVVIGADRMLAAFYDIAAFVAAGAIFGNATVIVITDHVLLRAILIPCTLVGTRFIDLDTGIVLTNETLVVAAEGRIARVIACSRKNDTFHALTYRVFVAGDLIGAFVFRTCACRRTVFSNAAIVAVADVVLGSRDAAVEDNRITCVFAVTGYHDACGVICSAFCMFVAVDTV